MGEWMSLPNAEYIIAARCSLKKYHKARGYHSDCSMYNWYNQGDVANIADLEGTDFDVINSDLVAYYFDCDDIGGPY